MDDELSRYYIKIRAILDIDPTTIHEEFSDPVLHHIQQLQAEQNVFVKEEKMSMIIIDLLASTIPQFTAENIQLFRQVISNDPHSTST